MNNLSMNGKGNVLILAPHTDDGELGCGATIARYAREGRKITYLTLANCSKSLPAGMAPDSLVRECKSATAVLGINDLRFFDFEVRELPARRQEILEIFIRTNQELEPEIVFLPARNDVHQDHHVVYSEGLRAFKNTNLLGYELPWNNTRFQPNYFEPVSEIYLAKKLEALSQYKSQSHRKYMNEEFTRSLAIVRGIQCNHRFAEAFEIYKMIAR